ncbi:cysteine hydrolase family protein [Glutamicibacter sp. AGC46]
MMTSTKTALIVVDMQQGFYDTSWGPTTNYPQCENNVDRLLLEWSEKNLPIVIVRHDSRNSDSPLFVESPGNNLHESVQVVTPDLFVTKSVNSSFYGFPDLGQWLRSNQIKKIVVCGIQTNLCVETTARMGGNLGFDVIVPLDATRTFDLAGPDGTVIPAATLMQVTATNLHGDGFALVVSTQEILDSLKAA